MFESFPTAGLGHIASRMCGGDAARRVLTARDFAMARAEIAGWEGYMPTPLVRFPELARRLGVSAVIYKDEGPRFGLGSFKALGGAYAAQRLLQREISSRTGRDVTLSDIRAGKYATECAGMKLVAATDGNHGRALAWGCRRFGASCRIYIHAGVSEGRAAAIRDLGADVIRIRGDYDASVALARQEAAENGWFVVSDTSWPGYSLPPRDVMSGYGVMAQEICDTLDDAPTHMFLQGGVGGFAAGVIAALRQHWGDRAPRPIVVEPALAACLFESARAGRATSVAIASETVMAGLSCGEPSPLAWEILAEEASDFLTIPDSVVAPAVRLLANPFAGDPMVEAGESAVAGLAALIVARQDQDSSEKLGLDGRSRVLLIGTEGVTDRAVFDRMMGERDGD
ncbi:MAG: diaminopropionate ammonia-lyase [Rhodospirillaceae bacterium]|nr:diaminopropionate ammonia-lyase [Rhodospirillaceae bacterium]